MDRCLAASRRKSAALDAEIVRIDAALAEAGTRKVLRRARRGRDWNRLR